MNALPVVVIIPVFNNGATVGAVIRAVRRATAEPIIVVDDGSTDGTIAAIEAAKSGDSRVTVRRHAQNRGKGAALRTGFAAASELGATHAVTIDADGQHDAADLARLVERCFAEDAGRGRVLVIGRRPRKMARCPRRCTVGRWFSNLMVRVNAGLELDDSQSGFRVYPLEFVEQEGGAARAQRYGYETEMIVLAGRCGVRVVEEPISCRYLPRGERVSHYRAWVDTWRHVVLHASLLWESVAGRSAPAGASHTRRRGWRSLWRMLWGAEYGARSVSLSLAVGVFIGCSPLFGLHAPICLGLGWRTRLRTLPLLLGSQVSIPPLGAVLAVASIAVGRLLLTGRAATLEDAPDSLREVAALSADVALWWLVGWLVVGGGLALLVLLLPRGWRWIGRVRGRAAEARLGGGGSRGGGEPEQLIEAHGAQAAAGE